MAGNLRIPFKVFKFEIGTLPKVYGIRMPVGSKLLSVQRQGGGAVVYAAVINGQTDKEVRYVEALMTGQASTRTVDAYLGTLMLEEGAFVLHYFALEG